MKRLLMFAATGVTVVLALAACGSDDDSDNATAAAGAGGASAESVATVDGVGDVLVDDDGNTLYTADEEADGVIQCVDACLSFWTPLEAGTGTTLAASGVANLGEIERPDGTVQMTLGGRPLYTFTEDSPGEANGDGLADDFGDQHFTWRAVLADGTTAEPPGSTDPGGGFGY